MVRHAPLDIRQHRNLRVVTERGARYGDDLRLVAVVPEEFQNLIVGYPIFLAKDVETGAFMCAAMLGFDDAENLFLDGDAWRAPYVPLDVERRPFLIGGDDVHIDLDSPRIGDDEGERLFGEDGQPTDYLQWVTSILARLLSGFETAKAFSATLLAHDLIEPVRVEITLADGETRNLQGLYTINQERLAALSGQALQDLHALGYLQYMHLMIGSLEHVRGLIERKNERLNDKDGWRLPLDQV